MSAVTRDLSKPNACFNWSRLLLSASLPLVFGIFTIIFTLQQNSISTATREQDRHRAIVLREQIIYDTYISDISKLLLKGSFNRSNRRQLNYIGFKTVDVLQHLNADHKRDVILFVYNHELIRQNIPASQRVILSGADLTDVQFIQSTSMNCKLRDLYLPFVSASNIVFDGCDINFAVFNYSWMVGAKFIGSLMDHSKLFRANLTGATFHGGNLNQINFSHAVLVNSKFSEIIPLKVDLTNTDLLNSNINIENKVSQEYAWVNTRFPNGSFSAVDSSQLIMDGGAESSCETGRHNGWMYFQGVKGFDSYNTSHSSLPIPKPAHGECYFRKNMSSRMYQYVSKSHYSLLINAEIAYFNLSAFMGCTISNRSNDRILIDLRCFDEYHSGPVCGSIKTSNQKPGFHYYSTTGLILKGTMHLRVWPEIIISSPSKSYDSVIQICFIDEIKLFIFKKEK